ncbi:MAG: ABC transporter permease [Thermoanaerobaculia bacterium]
MPHRSLRTPAAPPAHPPSAPPGSARPHGGGGPGETTLRAAANLLQDARLALRTLARRPVFAATAVTSLVLGFGATATVFAVFDATVLRPLPFAAPERLVAIAGTVVRDGAELRSASYPDYLDWREARSLEGAAALGLEPLTWTGEAGAERLQGALVTPEYFPVLGVDAAAGRLLRPEDDAPPQGLPVAVLAHGTARRLFGGAREALGEPLRLDGVELRVVGVLPAGFGGLDGGREVWIPLHSGVRLEPGAAGLFESRGERGLNVVARLAPSAGAPEEALARAQAELDALSRTLAERYPETNRDRGARVSPLRQVLLDETPRTSTALLAAVGLVWLIAWVNVANLLLVRIEERRSEVAVRSALGARAGRLAGQLVVESLVLAALAAPPTLLVAHWGTGALASLAPVPLPGYVEVALGLRGVAFALGLVLVTGALLGAVAARRALRGVRPPGCAAPPGRTAPAARRGPASSGAGGSWWRRSSPWPRWSWWGPGSWCGASGSRWRWTRASHPGAWSPPRSSSRIAATTASRPAPSPGAWWGRHSPCRASGTPPWAPT